MTRASQVIISDRIKVFLQDQIFLVIRTRLILTLIMQSLLPTIKIHYNHLFRGLHLVYNLQ